MSRPFFCVVIPTYNAVSYLKRSLDSVLSQSFQDFEVIIVDNSSTDGTEEYLKSINNQRVSWFKVKNYGVIGLSRNVGIKSARGAWVAFLDADDEWKENKLEVVHEVLANNKAIDVLVHAEKVALRGKIVSENNYGDIKEPAYETLLFGRNQLSPSSTVVRTSLLRRLGGFSEEKKYMTAEDYDLWLRLARAKSHFHYLDEVLGIFHRFKGTASSNLFIHQNSGNQVFYDHLKLWGKDNNIEEETIQKLLSRRLLLSYGSSIKSSLKNMNFAGFFISSCRFIGLFIKGIWKGHLISYLKRDSLA